MCVDWLVSQVQQNNKFFFDFNFQVVIKFYLIISLTNSNRKIYEVSLNTISFIFTYLNINKNYLKCNKLIFCGANDKRTETPQA